MTTGRINIIIGSIVLILAAFGGAVLGNTMEAVFSGGMYNMTFQRALFISAHTHGTLFAFFNLIIGFVMNQVNLSEKGKKWLSVTAVISICLPIGLILRGVTYPIDIFAFLNVIGGLAFFIASAYVLIGALRRIKA